MFGFYFDCLLVGELIYRNTFFFLSFNLQSTEQVAAFCRSLHDMNPSECVSSSPSPDSPFPPPATPRQLSDADKLRKVICELVETERTYVKVSITHLTWKGQMVFECACVPLAHRSVSLSASGFVSPKQYLYTHDQPIFICVPGNMRGTQLCPCLDIA